MIVAGSITVIPINTMEVKFLEGCKSVINSEGDIFRVSGIEITRKETGEKILYDTNTSLYHCCSHVGLIVSGYIDDKGCVVIT